MDETLERIKDYVLIIDGSLTDDDYLDYVIGDVVDRALIYTNRIQLIDSFEEDLEDEDVDEEDYQYPIPVQLERPLASVVAGVYKTIKDNSEATSGAITGVKDNGQEVNYSNELASYLSSRSDVEIFSGVRELLNKFRIPTVVENT
jgi:hypothetical protein